MLRCISSRSSSPPCSALRRTRWPSSRPHLRRCRPAAPSRATPPRGGCDRPQQLAAAGFERRMRSAVCAMRGHRWERPTRRGPGAALLGALHVAPLAAPVATQSRASCRNNCKPAAAGGPSRLCSMQAPPCPASPLPRRVTAVGTSAASGWTGTATSEAGYLPRVGVEAKYACSVVVGCHWVCAWWVLDERASGKGDRGINTVRYRSAWGTGWGNGRVGSAM